MRKVDDELIQAEDAGGAERRSAETKRREIREGLASRRKRKTLKDGLLEMPGVGDDTDFERPRDFGRKSRL